MISGTVPNYKKNLIIGLEGTGKTYLVDNYVAHLVEKPKYYSTPFKVEMPMEPGFHHIIDDCDVMNWKGEEARLLALAIRMISTRGRHDNTGYTLIAHHPTFLPWEMRMLFNSVYAFRVGSGALTKYMRHWFDQDARLLRDLPDRQFLLYENGSTSQCQLKPTSQGSLELWGSHLRDPIRSDR